MSKPSLVKYKVGKNTFEVVTKMGTVKKWREGKLGIDNVLITDTIFTNFNKGNKAKLSDICKEFKSNDEAIDFILKNGSVQVSASERKEEVEQKRKNIAYYIHKNYINPTNKLPHPISSIEGAIIQIKYRVDSEKDTAKQCNEIIKKLQGVMLFKKSLIEAKLSLSHKYLGSCTNIIYSKASVINETYTNTGCDYELELSPGEFDNFMELLNKKTKGDYNFVMSS